MSVVQGSYELLGCKQAASNGGGAEGGKGEKATGACEQDAERVREREDKSNTRGLQQVERLGWSEGIR